MTVHFAQLRADAADLFRAGVVAVDPYQLVSRHVARRGTEVVVEVAGATVDRWAQPTLVVGAGKAAGRMAAACEAICGTDAVRGEVIVADGCDVTVHSIAVTPAGHPLPDVRGQAAAGRLLELIKSPQPSRILCLIGGGASSLLVRPRPPVQLEDTIRTTQLLLACGASIEELNTVRKHLSEVKGGGFLRCAARPMIALLISDVIGDDPSVIGSGPTAPDPTTFADAWAVLQRHGLTGQVPRSVADVLKRGMDGHIPETVKPMHPEAGRCRNVVIGSNRTALRGAAAAARTQGWMVTVEDTPLSGDTTEAARCFGARLRRVAHEQPAGTSHCILAGGETTVRVLGRGRGGRNQEFALALAREIAGQPIAVLSAGTDGIDGPTDAAGAFADGSTLDRAKKRGLDAAAALANNDSYSFFSQLGDLYQPGPTGTNVMDVKIALISAARAGLSRPT